MELYHNVIVNVVSRGEEEARPAGHHIVVAVMAGGAVGELRENLHPLAG